MARPTKRQGQGPQNGQASRASVSAPDLTLRAGSTAIPPGQDGILLSRLQWLQSLSSSMSYHGRRNTDYALGYPAIHEITPQMCRDRYRRGGIAKRIVNAYPLAVWVNGVEIIEEEDPNIITTFEEQVAEVFNRLLWSRLLKSHILSRLGNYSLLFLGVRDKGNNLSQELPRLSSPADIISATPIAQWRTTIKAFDENPGSDRFGRPTLYTINFGQDPEYQTAAGRSSAAVNLKLQRDVHWSRVIHIAEDCLEDAVFGEPTLLSVWPYLNDLVKVVGGGAEAAWRRADPGMHVNISPEMEVDPAAEEALERQLKAYDHGMRRRLQTQGIDIEMLDAQVSDFSRNADSILSLIAGTLRIPKRILVGSEMGTLASDQDRGNFNDGIKEMRDKFAVPLIRELVDRLIKYGAILDPSEDYQIVWPEEEEMSETEKGALISSLAAANKSQADAEGVVILTSDEIRDRVYGLEPLEIPEDDIEPAVVEDEEIEDGDKGEGEEETPVTARSSSRSRMASLATEPVWKPIHRAADARVPDLESLFLSAWADGGREIDLTELTQALTIGSTVLAERAVATGLSATRTLLSDTLPGKLKAVLVAGGLAALRSARARGSWKGKRRTGARGARVAEGQVRGATFSASFDSANPRALAWAQTRSSSLITEITPATEEAMRELIAAGIRDGIPPAKLAQQIKESVGLRSDQVRAIFKLRAELASAEPGTLVTRIPPQPGLRDIAGFRAKIPANGATPEWIDAQAARYSKMSLNYRARTIARTETLTASNQGQVELWRQAQESGTLSSDAKRVWIATDDSRTRDEHAEVDGEEVGINEPFSNGEEPGEAVNCILPGATVSGKFVGGLEARYSGPAREIKTRRGHTLRVTVNHPILTNNGWIPALALSQGDNLISYSDKVGSDIGSLGSHVNDDYRPPLIEDVFESMAIRGRSIMKLAAHDLHNDAKFTDGEISVVGSDGVLMLGDDIKSLEAKNKLSLPISDPAFDKIGVVSSSAGDLGLHGVDAPSVALPGLPALTDDSVSVQFEALPLQQLSIGPAADWDTIKLEAPFQSGPAHSGFVRQLLERSAGKIAFDEIIEVRDFDFRGHVYDLQSVTGWIVADGIVISNCRCSQGIA